MSTDVSTSFAARLSALRVAGPVVVPHVIDGQELTVGDLILREDPSNPGSAASGCHDAPTELVHRAVQSSRAAQRDWARVPVAQRAEHVRRAIPYVESMLEDWTARVALEVGKTEALSRAEVLETLEFLRLYSQYVLEPGAMEEQHGVHRSEIRSTSSLRPYGVFGIISPFNYPTPLTGGPAIAAVLAGNGVVIKGSHLTPWSAHAVYEMFEVMDLPRGLVNIIHGADEPGKALVASDVDGIGFVGSAEVGSIILRQMASGPYFRPVIAELGGKNPTIVTDTADLDLAADGIVFSAFDLTGQKCSALSRVLVTPLVHDELVAKVTERAAGLKFSDPAEGDSFAGPLISQSAVRRYLEKVEDARRGGFSVAGGAAPKEGTYFPEAVVVSGIPHTHALAREEHFLPFLTISGVESLDEALFVCNDVSLGLTAGIYTGVRADAELFLETIQAGNVNVNIPGNATTLWWPGSDTFGGWKGSGTTGKQGYGKWYVQQFAREQGRKVPVDLADLLD